jgi:hypothetical protein
LDVDLGIWGLAKTKGDVLEKQMWLKLYMSHNLNVNLPSLLWYSARRSAAMYVL